MMQKSGISIFCLINVRNLKVFLEVHGREIAFAKSEQNFNLTSMDAEAGRDIYQSLTSLYAYM